MLSPWGRVAGADEQNVVHGSGAALPPGAVEVGSAGRARRRARAAESLAWVRA
jgi:hypothetical protein